MHADLRAHGPALQRWNIKLLACIPDAHFLGAPKMHDFERLFKTRCLAVRKSTTDNVAHKP